MYYTVFSAKRLAVFLVLLVLMPAMGCVKTKVSQPAHSPLDGASDHKLAYGISIKIPQGWRIVRTSQENVPSVEVLRKALAEKNQVELLTMVRENLAGHIVAEARMILVNSTEDLTPETLVRSVTDAEIDELGKELLRLNQQNRGSYIDFKVERSSIDGQLCLLHYSSGKRPEGDVMHLWSYEIYLPDSAGVLLVLKGLSDPADVTGQLKAFGQSIRFSPR